MAKARAILLLALIVVAGLGSWWWWQDTPAPALRSPPADAVDYTLQDFTLTVMSAAGQAQYRLKAQTMAHYAHDDSARLTHPQVQYYAAAGASPWQMRAERGRMEADKHVHVQGDVRISGMDKHGRPVRMRADYLDWYPDAETIYSSGPIALATEGMRITAVGMRGNLGTKHWRLLTRVRGYYAPQ